MIKFDNKILTELIQNEITAAQLEIGFFKLGRNFEVIDVFEINDIYVENPTAEGYNFENSNFTIKERLEKLKMFNGWVHLAGGLSCGIKNQIISDFRLSKKYIESINYFTREDIINFNGKPDYELIDSMSGGMDYSIDNYILVYESKGLNFFIDPDKNTLTEIYTGKLDKDKYEIRKPASGIKNGFQRMFNRGAKE